MGIAKKVEEPPMSNTNYTLPERLPTEGEYEDLSHDLSAGARRHLPLRYKSEHVQQYSAWPIVLALIGLGIMAVVL